MEKIEIFWDPRGFKIDALSHKRYLRTTDGDSPFISMSIRMLSLDTPEVHYPGNQNPSKQDANLKQLADWIKKGKSPIKKGLGDYLYPKLSTGKAGTLQEEQGKKATEEFKKILELKLTRPNKKTKRRVFIYAAEEHFDKYNRLLAYISPKYSPKELKSISREDRATFNLLMIKSGWAALFLIYPSMPRHADLVMLQKAAKEAYEKKRGCWRDPMMLTGYEFRMCVKLYKITKKLIGGEKMSSREKEGWISRYCADMTTKEICYPQDYYKVKPYNRIFIWPKDVIDAVAKMNLIPSK